MKRILLLGSTGSIGQQTLEVVRQQKKFKVVGLACRNNIALLQKQINEFSPSFVCLSGEKQKAGFSSKKSLDYFYGEEGMIEMIREIDCDMVVVAISGAAGLKPAIETIRTGKNIALATKEVMVLAGELIQNEIKRKNKELIKKAKKPIQLLPIDSEHSAIWQCLRAGHQDEIEKIILTCSGGPFRNKKQSELATMTVDDALAHPTWKMGKRITIDSATLMNKGLEVIEACWLFNVPVSKIEVVIHPQSILHSAVVYKDGSVIGQFSLPDMRIPIQYALSFPQRLTNNFPRLSLSQIGNLTFEAPDIAKFPCLRLAYEALEKGGSMPAVLNAADEAAVDLFINKKITFTDIPAIIEKTMNKHKLVKKPTIAAIMAMDSWARQSARRIV